MLLHKPSTDDLPEPKMLIKQICRSSAVWEREPGFGTNFRKATKFWGDVVVIPEVDCPVFLFLGWSRGWCGTVWYFIPWWKETSYWNSADDGDSVYHSNCDSAADIVGVWAKSCPDSGKPGARGNPTTRRWWLIIEAVQFARRAFQWPPWWLLWKHEIV